MLNSAKRNFIFAVKKYAIPPVAAAVVKHLRDGVDISLQVGLYLVQPILRHSHFHNHLSVAGESSKLLSK